MCGCCRQFLILELAVDGLKLAALNTPSVLTTPLERHRGAGAGRIFGEIRLVQFARCMLYMAFVAHGQLYAGQSMNWGMP